MSNKDGAGNDSEDDATQKVEIVTNAETTETELDKESLPCIVCKKGLKQVWADLDGNQPVGGLAFTTYGHYGSTVFDPMDTTHLEVNICDDCVKASGGSGLVLLGGKARKINEHRLLTPWNKEIENSRCPHTPAQQRS